MILPQEKEEEEEEEEERRRIDAELKERLKGAFDDLDMEEEEEDESSYYGSPPPRISQDDMVTPGQQVPGRPWSHRASRYHDDMVTPGQQVPGRHGHTGPGTGAQKETGWITGYNIGTKRLFS